MCQAGQASIDYQFQNGYSHTETGKKNKIGKFMTMNAKSPKQSSKVDQKKMFRASLSTAIAVLLITTATTEGVYHSLFTQNVYFIMFTSLHVTILLFD